MGRGGLERREGLGDLAGRGVQAAALRRAAGGGGGRAPEGGAGAARDRGGDAQEHDAPEQGARAGALSAGAARAAPGPRGADRLASMLFVQSVSPLRRSYHV